MTPLALPPSPPLPLLAAGPAPAAPRPRTARWRTARGASGGRRRAAWIASLAVHAAWALLLLLRPAPGAAPLRVPESAAGLCVPPAAWAPEDPPPDVPPEELPETPEAPVPLSPTEIPDDVEEPLVELELPLEEPSAEPPVEPVPVPAQRTLRPAKATARAPEEPPAVPTAPRPAVRPAPAPSAPTPGSTGAPAAVRPSYFPDPPYTAALQGVRSGLTAVLVLRIAADGTVVAAQVERSSGHPAFDAHAQAWVLARWRFAPPGQVVRTRIPVHYRP